MADSLIPNPFPPEWASEWGEDDCGLWIAFTYKGIRHAFRWIPPGRFMMGSPESEAERDDDEDLHEVTLTAGYWLGETTVTQALWEVVMGENPSDFKGPERPVETVSWLNAAGFMQRLNSLQPGLGLRFPTEAEWEHACRAGTSTPFSFDTQITPAQVNYNGNYPYAGGKTGENRGETVEVTALPSNSWGLYQMHGNVYEWCSDWFGDYPSTSVVDPTGLGAGDYRVLRGGSWYSYGHRRALRVPRHLARAVLPLPRQHWLSSCPRSKRRKAGMRVRALRQTDAAELASVWWGATNRCFVDKHEKVNYFN